MDKQDIYNRVKAALLAQGSRSVSDTGCVYRSTDGKRCALGHLIDDEHYSPELEGNGCGSMIVIKALQASGISVSENDSDDDVYHDHRDFLRKIQMAHDSAALDFVPEFTARMAELAREYNLEE